LVTSELMRPQPEAVVASARATTVIRIIRTSTDEATA
jgi:hypothetical protein